MARLAQPASTTNYPTDHFSAQHYRRETKTLATETKAFACEIFAKGARLSALTINPVQPKRVVASEQEFSEWLSLT
jgi:hypothetical protein